MRTVFFGTPAIAVPALRALAECSTVVGVVCQPDRPSGRGMQVHEPEVKSAARQLGLEVYQPTRVRTGELTEWIRVREVDLALVMAYGRILPPDVLSAPAKGCTNLHASLLPQYRGAAPVQWTIMRGERESGISLMQMDEGMDTGPVYLKRALAIDPNETAGELAERLAKLAARVVKENLAGVMSGALEPEPQNHDQATQAPPITREHAVIDWHRSAQEIHDQVRGLAPKPGAFTLLRGQLLKVFMTRVSSQRADCEPGTVSVSADQRVWISTGLGTLELCRAQVQGRKILDAQSLLNGRALSAGEQLGQ